MAVFRIEKTRDYTVMSNHHLRNAQMSLKSKGLLSMMLSLPEDWNYTNRGLAKICKGGGTDSIGSALKELEQAGYIVRNRLRDSKGKIVDVKYVIYEMPPRTRASRMRTSRIRLVLIRKTRIWITHIWKDVMQVQEETSQCAVSLCSILKQTTR